MFKKFFAWLASLFGGSSATAVATPATPVVVSPPAPIVPVPPIAPVVGPVVGGDPIPHNSPSYGTPGANGYCTVAEVEAMRAEIAAADPSYHLARNYLCPVVANAITDAKQRIAAQWACSQAAYWNMSAIQGGYNPFYPGVQINITVRPGQEVDADSNPLKWNTSKGALLSPAGVGALGEDGDYLIVSSIRSGPNDLYTGAGIAAATRARWQEDLRRRNKK